MKPNLFKLCLTTIALLAFAGCSMRPLSAGAFMEAYQSVNDTSKTVYGLSVTGMRAFVPNSVEEVKDSIGHHEYGVKDEILLDFTVPVYHFISHFEIGGGLQYFTPYVSLGLASDHFGMMGWGSFIAGGISVMEQISPKTKMHIGLFQFASRSISFVGCKEKESTDCGEAFGTFIKYFEFGGGTYFMYKTGFGMHLGFEFRYSHDITYKANRFAFAVNILGH